MQPEKQQKFSVVVVEDDESIGEMLVMLIKEVIDCQIYYFTRGSETLQAMQHTIPDLFILDYQLPSMTGIQLYDRLQGQKELCNVPTIMISANLPRKDLETRHIIPLEKPFEIDELLQIIDSILFKDLDCLLLHPENGSISYQKKEHN